MAQKLGIIVGGARGRMGQALVSAIASNPDLALVGAIEHEGHPHIGTEVSGAQSPRIVDTVKKAAGTKDGMAIVVEFTAPEATLAHVAECVEQKIPIVIGTTGLNEAQIKILQNAAKKIPIVYSPNFSIGVTLMTLLAEELAARLPEDYDLEVVEMHHRLKKDAPSGTALRLAEALAKGRKKNLKDLLRTERSGAIGERPRGEIGVQTLRGGDVVGDHTILFAGPGERLELKHQAHSRENFAQGALRAALYLHDIKGKAGLYDMFDVLGLKK